MYDQKNVSSAASFTYSFIFFLRSDKSNPGFHESVFCSLQALRDREFSIFDDTLKRARWGWTPEASKFGPIYYLFIQLCPRVKGGGGGGALQRHLGGRVFPVSGPEEPAEHQRAGERQAAFRQVISPSSSSAVKQS